VIWLNLEITEVQRKTFILHTFAKMHSSLHHWQSVSCDFITFFVTFIHPFIYYQVSTET